ncbi:MAG: Fic family protein [Verrucomicrobiales bacterium]
MDANLKDLLSQITTLKAEVDALRPLPPEIEGRIFQKFRLDWNYHSNAIEGNKLTHGETAVFLLEGLTAQGKPLKDHLDIKGHNEVINYLLHFVRSEEELTEAFIREMHRVMLVESYQAEAITPDGGRTRKWIKLGEYKSEPNQVLTRTGEVHFYTTPEETPDQMHRLIQWFREARNREHPLIIASSFHHRFTAIHPFDDGNGRMARLLMNLILMKSGFPPIVIKTTDRDAYFGALVHADQGEILPLTMFFAKKLISSLELYIAGSHGKTIEEPDDIDKKIALLKQELSAEPDAVAYSKNIYEQVVKGQLAKITEKFFMKMELFDPFFLKGQAYFEAGATKKLILTEEGVGQKIKTLQVAILKSEFKRFSIGYELFTFKKAGINAFDCSCFFSIEFKPLAFSLSTLQSNDKKFLYSTVLTDEQITEVPNLLAASVLKQIEQRRKPPLV